MVQIKALVPRPDLAPALGAHRTDRVSLVCTATRLMMQSVYSNDGLLCALLDLSITCTSTHLARVLRFDRLEKKTKLTSKSNAHTGSERLFTY